MPEKQKTHNWTETQMMIAAGAMLGLLAIFNVLASVDRQKEHVNSNSTSTVLVEPIHGVEALFDNSEVAKVSAIIKIRTGSS